MSGGAFALRKDPFILEGMSKQWFSSGRGPIVIANNASMRATVENPVGSGKLIQIHRLRIFVTSSNETMILRVNPTTNLPAFVCGSPNRYVGGPAGVAVIKVDAGAAMSGGAVLPYEIPIASSDQTFTEFIVYPGITLPPGVTLGMNFLNDTGGSASDAVILGDWREIPLG